MTSLERMKQDNEKQILKVVHENPGIYRKLVAKETNLASQTVTNLVTEMLDKKLIVESYNKADGRGRVPISLSLNYRELYMLTVNLELDWVSVYMHALDETILASTRVKLTGEGSIIQILKEQIAMVMQDAGEGYQLQALVISVCGVVNEDTGTVVLAQSLNLYNCNLAEQFSYLGIPVLIRNDVNLIAAYEKIVCKEDMNFMVAKLDIGIGSAFVLGSRSLKSSNNVAGELGHVTVESDEIRPCICGKNNCLTKFICREALVKRYGKSYEEMVRDAQNGKARAIELAEMICGYLAPVLANIINILDLDRVILCGGTVDSFSEFLYPCLSEQIGKRLSYWSAFKGLKLHKGIDIVAISAKFWLDYFFSTESIRELL